MKVNKKKPPEGKAPRAGAREIKTRPYIFYYIKN
nr:MAG TPA: hypothetical protein [Caudoviricetes sp.]